MTTSREDRVALGRPSRERLFARFDPAAADLQRLGGLPSASQAAAVWDDIWHLDAHNSTAIEGNTLVLREVQVLLDQGRAVGAKDIKDYLEVLGYGAAAKWVYSQALGLETWTHEELVTMTEIRQIHTEAMSQVWDVAPHPDAASDEGPGRFRRHNIHAFGGGMTPPPWPDVSGQMRTWINRAWALRRDVRNGTVPASSLPLRLADLHAHFERVHPFIDGNGRTGRLVLNLMLVRLGWPPAIVFKRMGARYLAALDRADQGDVGPLAEMIARSVLDNLERLVFPNIAGPARMVPLASLAGPDVSLGALRRAADRGRLDAELGADGHWRSNKHAVDEYLSNRHRRLKA